MLTGHYDSQVHIIGGGLAGCEAAWQLLKAGIPVTLYEMRPQKLSPAHKTGNLAELVCSNSFKSTQREAASGRLKEEMQELDSLIVRAAYANQVPAGNALAVDRNCFSSFIKDQLNSFQHFRYATTEIDRIPSSEELIKTNSYCILATGPMSSSALISSLKNIIGCEDMYFYDAIAPIIATESIDFEYCFRANRYDEAEDGDYINIPLNKDEYVDLVNEINKSEKTPLHDFENTRYFESCLPIEVMAERGHDTLRFGPLKPVGLIDPKTKKRAHAVIQLRLENKEETMVSMVGFQTKMKWPEQKRIFSKIPALKNAEFFRFGSVHRNFYVNGPKTLNAVHALKANQRVFLAGQITGVEGYLESASSGLITALAVAHSYSGNNNPFQAPPEKTIIGSLFNYVHQGQKGDFSPMNANWGLVGIPTDPTKKIKKTERKKLCYLYAQQAFTTWREKRA